ncbi:MAG: HAMP domain-containing sensor histidine kinase [Methylococcales bacterium]|nr:HAMP domain-containing sensor histidine kinase [Methylococcales bacterium]
MQGLIMMSLNQHQRAEHLTDAFKIFNDLSENLVAAYQRLEQQVAVLNMQLAAAQSEKLKALEDKEHMTARLQQLLAALPAAVLVLDNKQRIVDHNDLALTWLDSPLLGESWRTVEQRCCATLSDNPHERILHSGQQVSLNYSHLPDEQGMILLLSDVSDLKNLQAMLHQQQQLSAMGEMVASLAHQVRTPLAAALLYASSLPRLRTAPDKHRHYAEKIVERLQFMEAQVSDMLLFAKTGRMAKDAIDWPAFVHALDEAVRERLPEGIAWTLRSNINQTHLVGNEPALKGALLNLINNAIDAVGVSGSICLDIREHAQTLQWQLTDSGPGLPDTPTQTLFEPFYSTKTRGTGLGLAVVASVARAHGGAIAAANHPEGGAVFTLTLPLPKQTLPGGYCAQHTPFREVEHEQL